MSVRWKPPRPGTCRVCGCTEEHACDGGCSWVDRACTLCSACAGTPADLAYALRWIAHLLRAEIPVHGSRTAALRSTCAIAIEAHKRAARKAPE
jgi:hypothetical protein